MDQTALFTQALGLSSPWKIKAANVDIEALRVDVEVDCEQIAWTDPQTKARLHIQGYEKRQWRHLEMMQFETYICARVPRLKYPDGYTELLPVPWAAPHSRHSFLLKHGPSASFKQHVPSRTLAASCGSNGMPLSGSWTGLFKEG